VCFVLVVLVCLCVICVVLFIVGGDVFDCFLFWWECVSFASDTLGCIISSAF